jgi:hypothetical protein
MTLDGAAEDGGQRGIPVATGIFDGAASGDPRAVIADDVSGMAV